MKILSKSKTAYCFWSYECLKITTIDTIDNHVCEDKTLILTSDVTIADIVGCYVAHLYEVIFPSDVTKQFTVHN